MLTRRSLMTVLVGCCSVCSGRNASSQRPRSYAGSGNPGLIACGSEPGSGDEFQPDPSLVRNSCGVSELDMNIGLERRTLDFFFGLTNLMDDRDYGRPSFFFYEDGQKRIGARALRGGNNSCSIYLGLRLIRDEMEQNSRNWQSVVIGTLAHEWAHAFQYRSQLDEKRFVWETHADYLAGWYLGAKQATGSLRLEPGVFSRALFARGSNLGRFSEDAYGQPQQRADAMEAGLHFGLTNTRPSMRPNVSDAAEAGYDTVSAILQHERRTSRQ